MKPVQALRFIVVAILATAAPVLSPAAAIAGETEVITLTVRGAARQRILVLHPDGPARAIAILYPGGAGGVGIKRDGTLKRGTNFLVRSRAHFAAQGLLVAVVDRPSDWAGADKSTYRLAKAHVEDAAAIARRMRQIAALPVWFVGTSRGSISVAHIASRLGGDLIAGAVLSSSVTGIGGRSSQTVQDTDLGGIAVPVLVIGHAHDDCSVTPRPEQLELVPKLRSAAVAESIRIEGGDAGNYGAPCGPISHHGFLGQEEAVVARIADWILGHQKR